MATPAAEPTAEQLRLAYRQLHHPNRWPRTLEAALAHPVYGVCLRALARQISRPDWAQRTGTPPAVPSTGAPAAPPAPAPAPRAASPTAHQPQRRTWAQSPAPAAAAADRKRAAANDRDD